MCSNPSRPATRRHAIRTAPDDPADAESRTSNEDPRHSVLRVGERERELAADRLGSAFAQGYLSMDEYEARLVHTFSARTAADLDRLTADLPLRRIRQRDPRRQAARMHAARRSVQVHLIGWVATALLMIGIWLSVGVAAGSWYFWPIWPILGTGVGLIGHVMSVSQGRWSAPA
jgi:hypothetical protein